MNDTSDGSEIVALGTVISRRVAAARDRVWLASPYVTRNSVVAAFRDADAPSRRLLTRDNLSDILSGVIDLHVIAELIAAGIEVRVLRDVHAKVYVVDEWAYVGSANLTKNGLAASLREFGHTSGDANCTNSAIKYVERVWGEAESLSRVSVDSRLAQLERAGPCLERLGQARRDAEDLFECIEFARRAPSGTARAMAVATERAGGCTAEILIQRADLKESLSLSHAFLRTLFAPYAILRLRNTGR